MIDRTRNCTGPESACQYDELCALVNGPLQGAITRIQIETYETVPQERSKDLLENQLHSLGRVRHVDLRECIDDQGNGIICPREVLEGASGRLLGKESAALSLRRLADACITNVIDDVNYRQRNF